MSESRPAIISGSICFKLASSEAASLTLISSERMNVFGGIVGVEDPELVVCGGGGN